MTFTVLVTVFDILPASSTNVYWRVYIPTVFVSTFQLTITFVPLPSTLSVRSAPLSLYVDP